MLTKFQYLEHINVAAVALSLFIVIFYIVNYATELEKYRYLTISFLTPALLFIIFVYSFILAVDLFNLGFEFRYFESVQLINIYSLKFKAFFLLLAFAGFLSIKNYLLVIPHNTSLDYALIYIYFILFSSYLISSNNLGFSYICLEGLSISTYIMLTMPKDKISVEVTSKYMWYSICSSALLLLGSSFLFTTSKKFNLFFLELFSKDFLIEYHFFDIGLILVIFSFLVKFGAFPFHMWALDVYEGSWSPNTIVLMVLVKLPLLDFFIKMWCLVNPRHFLLYEFLVVCIIGNFCIGTLGAFRQNTIKRTLAYTSLIQLSFFFLGLISGNFQGLFSSLFHMIIYLLTLMTFLLLLFKLSFLVDKELVYTCDLTGLGKYYITYALVISVLLLSLAGIPPFLGFFTKFLILISLFKSGHYFLTMISIAIGVIVAFIYIRFLKVIWFEKIIIKTKKLEGVDCIWSKLNYYMILFVTFNLTIFFAMPKPVISISKTIFFDFFTIT